MTEQSPTTDELPGGPGATTHREPEKAPAANGAGSAAADAAADYPVPVTLTSADVAALSRERQKTLLSVLPAAVAAILITNRPPQPPHVEYEAHKKLVAALARARNEIPPIPMDRTVDYVSKRTGEHVHYRFASLDAIHKAVTGPLSENGLAFECVFNGDVIVVLLSHAEGGIHLSWLPLPEPDDIKELASQITMRRRYLTVQLLAIYADEDTGERDIPDKPPQGRRPGPQNAQRRPAPAGPGQNRPRQSRPAAQQQNRQPARQSPPREETNRAPGGTQRRRRGTRSARRGRQAADPGTGRRRDRQRHREHREADRRRHAHPEADPGRADRPAAAVPGEARGPAQAHPRGVDRAAPGAGRHALTDSATRTDKPAPNPTPPRDGPPIEPTAGAAQDTRHTGGRRRACPDPVRRHPLPQRKNHEHPRAREAEHRHRAARVPRRDDASRAARTVGQDRRARSRRPRRRPRRGRRRNRTPRRVMRPERRGAPGAATPARCGSSRYEYPTAARRRRRPGTSSSRSPTGTGASRSSGRSNAASSATASWRGWCCRQPHTRTRPSILRHLAR